MSDGEILVKVEGVSKKFCRSLKKSLWYGVKDMAHELNPFAKNGNAGVNSASPLRLERENLSKNPQLRPDEFWAVNDVSFELKRGECLGLIGRNGAGKTTLLKMLNGLIKPDAGRIEMRGRVGALIALGAGFNPILTGRENIYVNGSVLGLSKREIDEKVEDIIDFADILDFIDSPVQSYSSGMQVRLGFAVATALKPDVLILDEVLAVGDASFRAKCYRRITELRSVAAVIFVSHGMEQIAQMCSEALVLHQGKNCYIGDVVQAIENYYRLSEVQVGLEKDSLLEVDSRVELKSIVMKESVPYSGDLNICIQFVSSGKFVELLFRISFFDQSGQIVCEHISGNKPQKLTLSPGCHKIQISLRNVCLRRGVYRVSIAIIEPRSATVLLWSHKQHTVAVDGVTLGVCSYLIKADYEQCIG